MSNDTKLATCCYCGSRTILKLTARKGHELACGSCGAPLHEMKWLKSSDKKNKHTSHHGKSHKPRKRQKSTWERRLKKAWDIIDDIID